ncbi:MAG: hypothetical protein AVDCRST_MAG56-4974 [uncultured Cytophagales bacterium]|uniref:Uncharacterized protein n=1 Tax=uncultured Cytophagales bacterium TaxID=158755 RepID=A0A6J4K464_9SPHI|nr:MAG: hypothetical protein AVDCRST_MAG56-4974 [uncultured Cytophagales bacterium]
MKAPGKVLQNLHRRPSAGPFLARRAGPLFLAMIKKQLESDVGYLRCRKVIVFMQQERLRGAARRFGNSP